MPWPNGAIPRASTARRPRQLKNFTGIDSSYERPRNPEIVIDTCALSPEEAAETVIARLATLDITDAAHESIFRKSGNRFSDRKCDQT